MFYVNEKIKMIKLERILIIATPTQLDELENNQTIDYSGKLVDYCCWLHSLAAHVSDCEKPAEVPRSEWNLPDKVYYTGQIRIRLENGGPSTIDDPKLILEALNQYGVKNPIKLDI